MCTCQGSPIRTEHDVSVIVDIRMILQWGAGGDIPQLNRALTRACQRATIRAEGHAVASCLFTGVSLLSQ